MEDLNELKAILKEGLKIGATYIDSSNTYIKTKPDGIFVSYFTFQGGEWVEDDEYNILLTRSLSDIQTIVNLKEENVELIKALSNIISCDEANTGNEPSISCFQRSIDEAKLLLLARSEGE